MFSLDGRVRVERVEQGGDRRRGLLPKSLNRSQHAQLKPSMHQGKRAQGLTMRLGTHAHGVPGERLGPVVVARRVAHCLVGAEHLDHVDVEALRSRLAADDPALLDDCRAGEAGANVSTSSRLAVHEEAIQAQWG